ncbi:MAG: DUF711 family protein [Desulfurococcaceae archaeon]|nr:DUF711 family protein [Desulfurococcaceae archaeon]
MALIRALAIHIPYDYRSLDSIDKNVEIVNKVRECTKKYQFNPWTLRLIFPSATDLHSMGKYLKELFSVFSEDVLVSISYDGDLSKLHQLAELIQEYKKFYSAVRCDNDDALQKTVSTIYIDNKLDPNTYTRFAIVIGSWIETPYFPATCNVSNTLGFSISLRYVDLVYNALFRDSRDELFKYIQEIQNKAEQVSKCCGIPFLGIDMSLSPWREESVCMIIENLINNKIGFPGTLNAIHSLNKLIFGLIKKLEVKSIGFNEVMLPVAEDAVLNERVKEVALKLRDLVNYSILCVAGLDMVAIPLNLDIYRLAIDMLTIYRVKKRTVAMRIIPVDQEPGTALKLENFGVTYVVYP